ncbi:MAG: LysR family transcriptional regulator [Dehalococcoidia bacterium]
MFTLEQLEALRAIVRAGTYSRAADSLYLTQSALSQRIKHLEATLGAEVFDRGHRGQHVTLTPAGQATLLFAHRVFGELDKLERQIRSLRVSMEREVLSIAVGPNAVRYILPDVLARFQQQYPLVRINVVESIGWGSMLPQLVRSGACELAISSPVPDPLIGFTPPVTVYRVVLVGRADHPLASIPDPQPEELFRYPFALPPPDSEMRQELERAALAVGGRLDVVVESGAFDVLKEAVLRGIALGVMPDLVLRDVLSTNQVVRITALDYPRDRDVCLIYDVERELSPAATAFISVATTKGASPTS